MCERADFLWWRCVLLDGVNIATEEMMSVLDFSLGDVMQKCGCTLKWSEDRYPQAKTRSQAATLIVALRHGRGEVKRLSKGVYMVRLNGFADVGSLNTKVM
jgi:hypothetical protein